MQREPQRKRLLTDLPAFNAVQFRGLYLKPKSITQQLVKSVRLVVLEAILHAPVLGRAGSATLLRHGNANYIVTTRHELGIANGATITNAMINQIRISSINDERLTNIPTDLCIIEHQNPDQEYHDLLALRAVEGTPAMGRERHNFVPVTSFAQCARHVSMFVGHPTLDGVMDYENDMVNLMTAVSNCTLDVSYQSNAQHLRRYRYADLDYHVDGFSGGAVFSLIGETGSMSVVFDGIITRGGNGYLHVIDADYVLTLLSA